MTVEPWQLQQNAVLDVDGSRGFVLSTDAGLTAVVRDNGKVEFYTTESVAENATVHEDSPVQAAPAPQPATTPQPQPVDQPTRQPVDQPAAPVTPDAPSTPVAPVDQPTATPIDPTQTTTPVPPDSTTGPDAPQPPPPTPDAPQAVPVADQPTPDNSRQQTP